MIKVINLRDPQLSSTNMIYVGRKMVHRAGSPLGNPYKLTKESERAEVCERYEAWLRAWLEVPSSTVAQEIERLTELARQGGLILACWCAPKLCHADVIKEVIEDRLKR